MNFSSKALAVMLLCSSFCLLPGCASSNLVNVWHDPLYKAPPLGKILIIAVRKDATKRRIWEDAFTGELAKHGVTATSSYNIFPDVPPDTHQVIATVRANNFDGVIAIFLLPTEMTSQRIPGYTTTEQDERHTTYHDPYWRRYRTYYREIEHPGYIDTQTVDVRAIDVTTTGTEGKLIWSATSRTPDPGSVTDVQRGIVSLVLSELERQNIISIGK